MTCTRFGCLGEGMTLLLERSNHLLLCMALVIFGLGLSHESRAEEPQAEPDFSSAPHFTLDVIRVMDDDFPALSDADMKAILQNARKTYQDKFGLDNVRFKDHGSVSIESFFKDNLNRTHPRVKKLLANRFIPGQNNDFTPHMDSIRSFLKNSYKASEIDTLLPKEQQGKITQAEDFAPVLVKQMREKIEDIARTPFQGKALLRKEKAFYRSANAWFAVMLTQDRYDVVLTNTLVVLDNMPMPVPHSVFGKCIVGGFAAESPKRTVFAGNALMGSTFPLDTPLKRFWLPGHRPLSPAERNEVVGAYTIAHELGHAILNFPDLYGVEDQCLMNNRKDISWKQAYDLMKQAPGPCKTERPWRAARALYWDAEQAMAKKKYDKALSLFTRVVKETPRRMNLPRARFLATAAYQMSRAYLETGKTNMALTNAKRAATWWPHDERFKTWAETVAKRSQAEQTPTGTHSN